MTASSNNFDPYHVWLGIPLAEQPPSLYRLLSLVEFEENADVIASAADRQMAHLKSFQSGTHSDLSQKLLNEVAAAKIRLLNVDAKASYDEYLNRQLTRPTQPELRTRPLPVGETVAQTPALTVAVSEVQPSTVRHSRARSPRGNGPLALGVAAALLVLLLGWLATRPAPQTAKVALAPSFAEPAPSPPKPKTPSSPIPDVPASKAQTANTDVEPNTTRAPSFVAEPPEHPTAAEATGAVRPIVLPDFGEFDSSEASENSTESDPKKPMTKPKASVTQPVDKQTPPDEAAQQAIRRQLAELYDEEEAVTPEEKLKLARQYIETARELQGQSNEQFVLLSQAVEIAIKAGDGYFALDTLDAIDKQFEIDPFQAREDALVTLAEGANTQERIKTLTTVSIRAIKQALAAERRDSALNMAETVIRACRGNLGRAHRKQAIELREWVQMICRRQDELASARQTLLANVNEPEAHLVLGNCYAFYHNDWEQGLPHLAKCSNESLKALAQRDLAAPSTLDERIELGDAWWAWGDAQDAEQRDASLLRAGYWYRLALDDSLAGLRKLRLEKRMEELVEVGRRYRIQLAQDSLDVTAKSVDDLWKGNSP